MAMIIVSPVGVPAVIPAGYNYHISPSAVTTNSSGKMGHLYILLSEKIIFPLHNVPQSIIFPEKKKNEK